MKNSYLNTWIRNFPDLQYLLSLDDKKILDGIDPLKYSYLNITKSAEVIRIIDDYRPQAWKWERLYPGLKDLSAEDHAVLEHIVPTDYMGDITEADVRRIIEYRKRNKRKEEDDKSIEEARRYYADHETEILKEQRERARLTKFFKYSLIAGITIFSAGVPTKNPSYLASGFLILSASVIHTLRKTLRLNKKSVIPIQKKDDSKMGIGTLIAVISYYIGLIGVSIALSSLIAWTQVEWYVASRSLTLGISIAGGSLLLFVITMLAVLPKD